MEHGRSRTVHYRIWPPVAIGIPLVVGWLLTRAWGDPVDVGDWRIALGWALIAVTGGHQTIHQDVHLDWEVWALLVFATLGPLVTTNVLWFRSLDRIGPARATLAANLNPFVAVLFAVVLLSESLSALQLAGGALIAVGILLARRRRVAAPVPAE